MTDVETNTGSAPKVDPKPVKPKKAKKRKGPIRTEAVVPTLIICAGIWGYFTFLFDMNLRKGLELGGSRLVGAEVNIGYFYTSFIGGSLTIGGIGITDRENPMTNSLAIGRMHFKFSWNALLRGKFVVNDASIESLQVGTPRKHAGFVIKDPEPEPAAPGTSKSMAVGGEAPAGVPAPEPVDEKRKMLDEAAQMVTKSAASFDVKPPTELKSSKKIEELKARLTEKEKIWKDSFGQLQANADFKALQSRIQNVKVGGTQDPNVLRQQLEEAQKVLNETNEKINSVRSQGQSLSGDIQSFSGSFKEIEAAVAEDRTAVESQLKLPKLDMETLSKQLFGPQFTQRLNQAKKYMAMAKEYMPPKKTKAEKEAAKIPPHERAKGKNIRFPITTGFPLFWLRRAALSSKPEGSPFGGNFDGQILDVTSDPDFIQRPTLISIKGDFPTSQIYKVDLSATLDHTKDVANDSATFTVGSFPVGEKMLTSSESLTLGFKKAGGTSKTKVQLKGDQLSVSSQNFFDQVDYIVESNSGTVKEMLGKAVQDVPRIAVDVTGLGTIENLNFDIRSNLGEALQRSFEKQLKAKLDEAQAKVRKMIEERIAGEKKQLEDQFNGIKNQYTSQISNKQKEIEGLKGQAQNRVEDAKKEGMKSIGVPQNADDLKKKLGF